MTRIHGLASLMFGMVGALSLGFSAFAQAPRSGVESPSSAGVPEFRDPKTGKIWTPLNVGQRTAPDSTPADRAFDPRAQAGAVEGVVVQKVPVSPLGSVPITAGPAVPIVTLETATLQAVPGQRWQVTMYLSNNSANAVAPVISCDFTNSGAPVETTRAELAEVGSGSRVGFVVYGPKVTLYVDRANCRVISP
jgi:hypothetical protein